MKATKPPLANIFCIYTIYIFFLVDTFYMRSFEVRFEVLEFYTE